MLFPAVIYLSSCKKKDECKAGTGGSVTLKLNPQHHGVAVGGRTDYPDSAFLKFDAADFPGTNSSNYDIVAAGNGGDNYVKVSGLKCGQYFIYMTGFDTSSWHVRVVGGIPYNFSQTTGEVIVTVPVTE